MARLLCDQIPDVSWFLYRLSSNRELFKVLGERGLYQTSFTVDIGRAISTRRFLLNEGLEIPFGHWLVVGPQHGCA